MISVRTSKAKDTHLDPIQLDIPMYNQPPRLIHTMHKTTPKQKNIQPSLHLHKHQTPHRRHPLLGHLLLLLHLLLPRPQLPPRILLQIQFVPSRKHRTARTYVRDVVGQIPPLERLFRDKIPMVSPHGGFGAPALLEQSFFRGEFERELAGFRSDSAFPKVVQILW